jgi:hypothetical protein
MTDTWWWKRLSYAAMSLFVAWHTLAMMVAPMPDSSAAVRWLRSFLNPYLYAFRLDNRWSFFAPNVGKQLLFRYVVEDGTGNEHVFEPLSERSWSVPKGAGNEHPYGPVNQGSRSIAKYVMWRETKYLYDGVMDDPESRTAVVAQLCQRHASLKPVAVSFLMIEEREFWPEDYLKGHRPLDPDFVVVRTLTNTAC